LTWRDLFVREESLSVRERFFLCEKGIFLCDATGDL
jgi:hypothetical protein